MALVQQHRFNWMGYEGTETELLNLALLRPGGDTDQGNLKFQDNQRRQLTTTEIKKRLRQIKQELGLLPDEEDANDENGSQGGEGHEDDDAINLDSDAESEVSRLKREEEEALHRREEEERQKQIAEEQARERAEREAREAEERRKTAEAEALAQKQREIDAAFDEIRGEHDPNEPATYQPTSEEYSQAVSGFSSGVRTLLMQRDATLLSYLNASSHAGETQVQAFNEYNRPIVENAIQMSDGELTLDSLPPAYEFDVSSLQQLANHVTETRRKYEAARVTEDKMYARNVRYDELNVDLTPVEPYNAEEDGDSGSLSIAFTKAKNTYAESRNQYNAKARQAAGKLFADDELAGLALSNPPSQ